VAFTLRGVPWATCARFAEPLRKSRRIGCEPLQAVQDVAGALPAPDE
jgi:hypothetical protein